MMSQQDLFKNIFHRNTWEPGNAPMLQQVAKEHPYFSLAHFYLLKETGIGHADYKKIAAKTALHFNNPFLLNWQLHKKLVLTKAKPATIIAETVVIPEPVAETLLIRMEPVPTPSKDEPLLFEPLHTSDYFASQGIRLSEEIQTGDKLGKQLKSFTEWLKSMKKVNGLPTPETADPVDIKVQQLAENSNKEEEVLTESMAEVFQQQGKKKKASDIYQKLSLLNPSKSAYFAAKIEFLNQK